MNSCLYQSRVAHARLAPARHAFEYSVFYCWIDLDELSEVDRQSRLFGVNRRALYSFHEEDHLQSSPGNLKTDIIQWLKLQNVEVPADCRIRVVTLPRFLGYVFNPVSFIYCYDAAENLLCGIAEVGNTFGEKKLYLLPRKSSSRDAAFARVPKRFYVSPFSDLDVEFEFEMAAPADKLNVRVDDYEGGEKVFLSTLAGQRRPLTTSQLTKLTVSCPAVTAKVIFLIHWQALLLWMKGFRWFAKADRPERQTNVLNPHTTIAGNRT